MANILDEIIEKKKAHIEERKKIVPIEKLREESLEAMIPKGFLTALKAQIKAKKPGIIAEVKRASPSKGLIREDFDHLEIAKAYMANGAACISVLTDEPYFQGDDYYLQDIAAEISIPVLRKDFMVDPYQVVESRALGADCILLIMAALSDDLAHSLEERAIAHGMDILVEVHDEDELKRALKLKSKLIGINNRNLKTMEVSLETSINLKKKIPKDYVVVCESGISKHEDIKKMSKHGIYSFLVGESLMSEEDVGLALKNLLNN